MLKITIQVWQPSFFYLLMLSNLLFLFGFWIFFFEHAAFLGGGQCKCSFGGLNGRRGFKRSDAHKVKRV